MLERVLRRFAVALPHLRFRSTASGAHRPRWLPTFRADIGCSGRGRLTQITRRHLLRPASPPLHRGDCRGHPRCRVRAALAARLLLVTGMSCIRAPTSRNRHARTRRTARAAFGGLRSRRAPVRPARPDRADHRRGARSRPAAWLASSGGVGRRLSSSRGHPLTSAAPRPSSAAPATRSSASAVTFATRAPSPIWCGSSSPGQADSTSSSTTPA